MPTPIAPIIEVYRKVETKLISPVCIAITLRKVPLKTATLAPRTSSHEDAITGCHSVPIIIIPENTPIPITVASATVIVGTLLFNLRVKISLTVMKISAATAESE